MIHTLATVVVEVRRFLGTIPWQWVLGALIPVVIAVYAAYRNQRQARLLFRKQVEYASYSRLADSLVELSDCATALHVLVGSLASELVRALGDEEVIRDLTEKGQSPESSPQLWARTKFAEGARERWRRSRQELFSKNQALSQAHVRFGREFEHHEIFFAALHQPKEDLGLASLRLHTQVGELADLLFGNLLSDPPYPPKEKCTALCAEARRLTNESMDLAMWTGQFSRLLQNLVLSDVARGTLPPPKVADPVLIVMTKGGLVRADVAGFYDPEAAAKADELHGKEIDWLWHGLPTNNPKTQPHEDNPPGPS